MHTLPRSLLAIIFTTLMFLNKAHAVDLLNKQAPAFRLQDGSGTWHTLEEYRGKWVVLYFYPKDGTPGCTTEACEFRDNVFAFRDVNAIILGISVDDTEDHKKFAEKHHLPFTLLADTDMNVSRAYGVLSSLVGFKMARRETFLIDPNGQVAKHYDDVSPKGHSAQVLGDIKALQSPR